MSNTLEQLDEKIAAYKKAKEALEELGDSISSFCYKNKKQLREEAIAEVHESYEKAYGKEYADKSVSLFRSSQEVRFCKECGYRSLGYCCNCSADC